jgi:membrane protease YdiL (CAAX protease family)
VLEAGPGRRHGPVAAAAAGAVLAGGSLLLAGREPLARSTAHHTAALVAVFLVLGAVGVAWPLRPSTAGPLPVPVVLGVGAVAFALGRALGGGHAPAPFGLRAVALNSLAAVAEEAFFRRFAYGVLAEWSPTGAIVGSALLFAVVHVTIYGAWVLPLDVAAGLVLGWQRWAGGRWSVPALTHVVANLLVMI